MAARILDGKALAAEIRREVAAQVERIGERGVTPGLAVVLVGDDPGSRVYVHSVKARVAAEVGIRAAVHELPATAAQNDLLTLVKSLNADPAVHGIIVQLPLPKGLDPIPVQETLDPAKDVDGLHPENAGLLTLGRPRFVPCTPLGIKVLLERSGIVIEGAHVVVVGRSNLVGRPVSVLLSNRAEGANATVTLCHTKTTDLETHTRRADVLIVAAGAPRSVTGAMIKPGAAVVDVGISRTEEGLVGDVDFQSALPVAGAITPVPGGVGPMTVAMLMANTAQAAADRSR